MSRLHHEIDEVSSLLSSLNAEYGRLGSGSAKRRKSKSGAKEGKEGEEEEDKSKSKKEDCGMVMLSSEHFLCFHRWYYCLRPQSSGCSR